MAITRAQQFRQMLEDGGMLVQPGFGGTRQGYRGSDFGGSQKKDTSGAEYGSAKKSSGGRKDEMGSGFYDTSEGKKQLADQRKRINEMRQKGEGIFANQKPKQKLEFDLPTRRIAYDFFGNNPKNELKFMSRLYNYHPEVYANLSPNLKSRFEETIAYDEDREFKDFDKFSYDDFTELTNFDTGLDIPGLQNFSEYAATYGGAPGLKFSGNVGNIQKFVTGKDPITGETMYDYREINKDDAGLPAYKTLIPQAPFTTPSRPGDSYYGEGVDPFKDRKAYRLYNKGGIADTVVGGEYDFESARQMYGLGKLVKKVTRTVKKIAKSPIGKAAIIGAVGFGIPGVQSGFFSKGLMGTKFGIGTKNFLANKILGTPVGDFGTTRTGGLLSLIKNNPMASIFGASALAGLLTPKPEDEEEDDEDTYRGEGLDFSQLRPYGIQRFAEGGFMKEPVAKKTMPLLDMGGKEMDLRAEGGFVPIGRMEKADDVPARLSKNEFVFTADAVRNAGDGDVDKGAEVMYNMMKNLESGGDVSEESQGLEGAKEMFQTSQRLGEVI